MGFFSTFKNQKCSALTTLKPKKGYLLIAEPSIIGDASFNRAVVLLAEENEHGFVGFILNKPSEFKLCDLVPGIDAALPVFNGGPVEQNNLYFIHKRPDLIPNSIEISSGIYWGGHFETITTLLQNNSLQKQDIRFFLGYSGWDAGQLQEELENNSWIVSKNNYSNAIITKTHSSIWREKMMELGGDYILWSNAPEDPTFN